MSHKSGSRTQQAHIVTCCGFDVIDHPVMEWMKGISSLPPYPPQASLLSE
jgi:hypothetical protein